MQKSHWYLIQYDIRHPKRLRRVHRLLKTCAFALQESVFAWQGTLNQLDNLQQQLQKIINAKEDDIRGYRIRYPLMLFGELPFTSDTYFAGFPPSQPCPAEYLAQPPDQLWTAAK